MSLNIFSIRIEICANMREQMQIFNFSLKVDYTCKLVNTQNSIRYMHITEFRAYISGEWLVERSPEVSIFPFN